MAKRILVTSALPYANGPIHLGHLAGAYLPADLYVRFKRLQGKDILFICGSDEHGVPITLAAEDQGVTPQDIVDKYHHINKKIFENFEISFDYYGRTSSETHYQTTQDFFKKLYADNVFKRKTQKQLYDEEIQMFLPDRYVTGTCPNCGYEKAYGDQCEKCGKSLSPTDHINPKSVLTGNTPITKETEHFYLPLGDYQEQFEEWLDTRQNWKPNVMGQVKSWLNEGLSDRAMTRDLTWGVPVPVEGFEDKVMYVWFDAPIGYISATREWAEKNGDSEAWKTYWQDEETELIHFIGKDNIVFHCIIFPILLMLNGDYVLPENVPANEFLNLEKHKFSTSRNWAVWLDDYLDDFEPDLLRYVLATILPETKDSNFSWEDFQSKVNNELADIFGNFAHRTISFTRNFADAQLPELKDPSTEDRAALSQIETQKKKIADNYNIFHIREAVAETMNLARIGNKYFTEMEPWHTRKTNKTACDNTLHVCLQLCAALSVLFDPVMPAKMEQLRGQLGISDDISWDNLNDKIMKPGQLIEEEGILFPKIEDKIIENQMEKLNTEIDVETNYEPLKNEISFDVFQKMDIRTGLILKAEKVEKSNKLLKISVNLGFEERTIVSGIANHFDIDSLTGQKVCVVANLAPKKLFGIESNGMILMAEDSEGNLEFVETDANPGDPVM